MRQSTRALVEHALQSELTTHLGYEKHSREGTLERQQPQRGSTKLLKGAFGTVQIVVSCYRQASFEPKLVAKGQTRFQGFDDKKLSLYARGMTTREIQGLLTTPRTKTCPWEPRGGDVPGGDVAGADLERDGRGD